MITSKAFRIALLAALLWALPIRADASMVTDFVTFNASGFTPAGAPVDPVKGSFTVTFDPALMAIDVTSGIAIDSLNISLGSSLSYTYVPATLPYMYVGGLSKGAAQADTSMVDMVLLINDVTGPGYSFEFLYTDGTGAIYDALSTTTGTLTPVPLPATLWVLGSGLLRLAHYRRRKLVSRS